MNLTPITPPTAELVTLIEARDQCRVSENHSDGQLAQLILSAREWAQSFTGRQIMAQTWELSLDAFPSTIELPLAPVQSIASIQYTDTVGSERTLDPTDYEADLVSLVPRIRPTIAWPSTKDAYNAVRVRFVAGYPATHPDLHRFRTAILLHVQAHFRLDDDDLRNGMAAAENLLWPLRRWVF